MFSGSAIAFHGGRRRGSCLSIGVDFCLSIGVDMFLYGESWCVTYLHSAILLGTTFVDTEKEYKHCSNRYKRLMFWVSNQLSPMVVKCRCPGYPTSLSFLYTLQSIQFTSNLSERFNALSPPSVKAHANYALCQYVLA